MLRVNNKTNELYLYDVIGGDWFGGGITSQAVVDALEPMVGQRVTVRINSPGGVADEGIAIYNALKRHEGGVNTVVDSLAASAASVIALAGENRATAKGARWMIHRAMAMAMGNAEDMQKTASILETYDRSIIEIYKTVMDLSEEEILSLMSAETWYTADEAIAAGLSTGKAEDTEAEPVVAAWFKNAPEAILNKIKIEAKPNPFVPRSHKLKVASR